MISANVHPHGFASLSSGSETHELPGGCLQPGSQKRDTAPTSRAPVCPNYLSGTRRDLGRVQSVCVCLGLAAGCIHVRRSGALGSEASEWVREGRGHPHTGHMARECGCCGALGRVGGSHTGPLQGDAETTYRGAGCEAPMLKEIQGDSPSGVRCIRIHLPVQGHGFEPWSGEIPQAAEQLSPCTVIPEAHSPWSPPSATRSHCSDKPVPCSQRKPVHRPKDPAPSKINQSKEK